MDEIILTPESSSVRAIAYSKATRELMVRFESGTYYYLDVPARVWREFKAAESKGGFVNDVLKPLFDVRSTHA
ncbi:KTSC domain-containing protein [Humibacter sp. BT305]|uniref:Uncharacterized protein n=1 Tax=Cnuibacter physcomitrellae TaxID=1619308 RepID=A0A1X9LQ41_9MICO|nr:KTSC domain-containing protein [Cnuibacter physcomitrellae]ARJ06428.1 hypothetical protein B5808_15300 [Cnuibacter physcomitrellae]AXH34953.1 KTSC domain-containing protein [Humibacter sp. BT305]GGI37988.1 hypothetical protein GCM10010988_16730 [Cnuibacter physcomitrellae]